MNTIAIAVGRNLNPQSDPLIYAWEIESPGIPQQEQQFSFGDAEVSSEGEVIGVLLDVLERVGRFSLDDPLSIQVQRADVPVWLLTMMDWR